MNWRQILFKAKAERIPLQKQKDEIQGKLYCLDKKIFEAEVAIKEMDERKRLKELEESEESEEIDCYNHPDNPPYCSEDK